MRRIVPWTAFILTGVGTWAVYLRAWMIGPYYILLSALGILSVGLAVWVVLSYQATWRTVILVVAGLLAGQWWLVEAIIVQGLWSITGLAP